MRRQTVLLIDSVINLLLGVLLIAFPRSLVAFLGIPMAEPVFYPSVLGAVLFGIGIALMIEFLRLPQGVVGLGLAGAVAINLCGGVALTYWLLSGNLALSFWGKLFLWALAIGLFAISGFEIIIHRRSP